MPAGAESAAPAVFHLSHLQAWEFAAAGAARVERDEEIRPEMFVHHGNVWGTGTSVQLWSEHGCFWKGLLEMFARKNELCEGNGNTRGRLCEGRLWRPGGCFSDEHKMKSSSLGSALRCRGWGNTLRQISCFSLEGNGE